MLVLETALRSSGLGLSCVRLFELTLQPLLLPFVFDGLVDLSAEFLNDCDFFHLAPGAVKLGAQWCLCDLAAPPLCAFPRSHSPQPSQPCLQDPESYQPWLRQEEDS